MKINDAVLSEDATSTKVQPYTVKREEESRQYVASAVSDNDSGVAADVFGLSPNMDSTQDSLNSSSKAPHGFQLSKGKNSSFRSSISSNSPSSSPDLPQHTLKTNTFARDSNRKSLSTSHPILYKWIDQQEKTNFTVSDNCIIFSGYNEIYKFNKFERINMNKSEKVFTD